MPSAGTTAALVCEALHRAVLEQRRRAIALTRARNGPELNQSRVSSRFVAPGVSRWPAARLISKEQALLEAPTRLETCVSCTPPGHEGQVWSLRTRDRQRGDHGDEFATRDYLLRHRMQVYPERSWAR